jgi:hypothetical protein
LRESRPGNQDAAHSITLCLDRFSRATFRIFRFFDLVAMEPGSHLLRLGVAGSSTNALRVIAIPASVAMIHELCFPECKSLVSLPTESASRLSRLGDGILYESSLRKITILASIEMIRRSRFYWRILEMVWKEFLFLC